MVAILLVAEDVTPAVAADMVVQAVLIIPEVEQVVAEEVLEVILATAELGTVAVVTLLVIVVLAAVEVEVDIIMVMVLVQVEVVV